MFKTLIYEILLPKFEESSLTDISFFLVILILMLFFLSFIIFFTFINVASFILNVVQLLHTP